MTTWHGTPVVPIQIIRHEFSGAHNRQGMPPIEVQLSWVPSRAYSYYVVMRHAPSRFVTVIIRWHHQHRLAVQWPVGRWIDHPMVRQIKMIVTNECLPVYFAKVYRLDTNGMSLATPCIRRTSSIEHSELYGLHLG